MSAPTKVTADTAKLPLMLTALRLPTFANLWPAFADRADREGWPAARFLAALAELELAERDRRRIQRHLREARLPMGKTLESFDFAAVPTLSKAHVMALAEGDSWLAKGNNILAFGPPGGGKSHLAAALGHALIQKGYRVLFTRTTDLVQRLQTARQNLTLAQDVAKLDKFHLLILDDLSYVQKDQLGVHPLPGLPLMVSDAVEQRVVARRMEGVDSLLCGGARMLRPVPQQPPRSIVDPKLTAERGGVALELLAHGGPGQPVGAAHHPVGQDRRRRARRIARVPQPLLRARLRPLGEAGQVVPALSDPAPFLRHRAVILEPHPEKRRHLKRLRNPLLQRRGAIGERLASGRVEAMDVAGPRWDEVLMPVAVKLRRLAVDREAACELLRRCRQRLAGTVEMHAVAPLVLQQLRALVQRPFRPPRPGGVTGKGSHRRPGRRRFRQHPLALPRRLQHGGRPAGQRR